MEKSETEFDFLTSGTPVPTIEVDIDSFQPDDSDIYDLTRAALSDYAKANPKTKATVYMYFTQSVNFGEPTSSEFFAIDGPIAVLEALLATFKRNPGLRCRFSDSIKPEHHLRWAHMEDGQLWQPVEAYTWSSVE